MAPVCTQCFRTAGAAGEELFKCQRCVNAWYCSESCRMANRPLHQKICKNTQANEFDREASALKDPISSLLSQQSHEYHNQFWRSIQPTIAKIGAQCALDPATWPPGSLIPVVLKFDYDYRKDTDRERFTLTEADVPTYASLLDTVALLGPTRRKHVEGLAESYLKTTKAELAKLGPGATLPPLFIFWFVWTRTDGSQSMEPRMRVQAFSRFIGIYPMACSIPFDYRKEFLDLLGPLPVVPKVPNSKERRKEERRQRFTET
ncbi:hypothetical protein RQP46_010570 [Phenoliferia psychrophenolica]